MKTSIFPTDTAEIHRARPFSALGLAKDSMLCALCLALAPLVAKTAELSASELSTAVALAAAYHSGEDVTPLRQIEELIRQAQQRPGLQPQLEDELLKLLKPDATTEARRFACTQLAAIGSERALPAIAALLSDEQTVTFACLALTTYPRGKADQILREALPTSRGTARVQIIATLGDRRDEAAVSSIAAIAREQEFAPMRAGITALGKIGTDAARRALAEIRGVTPPELARWFTEAELRIAENFAAAGNRTAAAKIYEALYVSTSQPASVRRGAFAARARLDSDGGERRILTILSGSDEVLRPVALGLVRTLPARSASGKFASLLPKLAVPEQVWLVESLAARGDAAARTALANSLGSTEASVRRAAAAALSRIGNDQAVHPFAKAIAHATDGDEARACASALGALPPDRKTDRAIFGEIAMARGETRAHLISALATRFSLEATTTLLAETRNSDPVVARAAYRVLARAGANEALPQLLEAFAAIRSAELRDAVAGFVERAVAATESSSVRSDAVLSALHQSTDVESRCALLTLLPACGGAAALAVLNDVAGQNDTRLREGAIRALAEWPDVAAWNPLAAIWNQTSDHPQRSVALRGLVRLAGEGNAHADAALMEHYRELLAGARGDDELKLILGTLGGAAHPDALKLALPLLEKPSLRAEAQAAVRKLANAIAKEHPEAAKAALEHIPK